jgi:pyruvate/2-oxoglutarate dehydrogenase complex dihydrolipoamide acyltransferase (E2) component
MTDIKLPELGEGISTVEISDILVKTGDSIAIDDSIIVVETEKVSMEITATSSGTVTNIHVKKGDAIGPGDIIISISGDDVEAHESVTQIENKTAEIKNGDQDTPQKYSSNKIDNSNHTKTYPTVSPLGKPVLASPFNLF